MQKIGIMGGTFNPIHFAHLTLAEFAREHFSFDKVMFLPSKLPAYKNVKDLADDEHRFNMTKLAISGNNAFFVSDIELKREGNTYTIDTVNYLVNHSMDVEYYFIIGGDSLFSIEKWKDFKNIMKQCKIVAAARGEYDACSINHKIIELNHKYKADIRFFSIPEIDISSSMIRNRLKQGLTVKYLMPNEVILYLDKMKLYI